MKDIKLEKLVEIARRYYRGVRQMAEFCCAHPSHAVAYVLTQMDEKYDIGYGEEGDCANNGSGHLDCQYINMGDPYIETLVFFDDQFQIACVGDIYEANVA